MDCKQIKACRPSCRNNAIMAEKLIRKILIIKQYSCLNESVDTAVGKDQDSQIVKVLFLITLYKSKSRSQSILTL